MIRQDKSAYLIVGNREYAKDLVRKLVARHGISDFDVKTVYADEVPLDDILNDFDFLPVFSEKKLVHVCNVENIKKDDREMLSNYMDNPFEHLVLVVSGSDAKEPLKKHADIFEKEKADEQVLFSGIYSIGREDTKRLRELIAGYLDVQPRNFHMVIAACELYLKKNVIRQKVVTPELAKKFNLLHDIDYSFKIGRLLPGPELEAFLYYLFS